VRDSFPRIIVGKGSSFIGKICPICKEPFAFGERLCLLDRVGTCAHDSCVYKDAKEDKDG